MMQIKDIVNGLFNSRTWDWMLAVMLTAVLGTAVTRVFVAARTVDKRAVELDTACRIGAALIEQARYADSLDALRPFVSTYIRNDVLMTIAKYYDASGTPVAVTEPQTGMFMVRMSLQFDHHLDGVYVITAETYVYRNATMYEPLTSLRTAVYAVPFMVKT